MFRKQKRYGVLYCAVRNPKGSSDGLVDVIVKEEDAPRINRIVDRFQFASVTEAAKIKTEIERTRAEKAKAGKSEKQEKKPEKVQVQQEKTGTGRNGERLSAEIQGGSAYGRVVWRAGKERGEGAKPLFGKRRPNPVCPSLPQRSKRKPQRVLLSYLPRKNQRNHRSERNFGKYRMQGRKKRSGVRIEMIR